VPKISLPRPSDCPDAEVRTFLAETDKTMQAYEDLINRGGVTSRIALSPVVGELQTLRRDYAARPRPKCAEEVATFLLLGMDATIDALLAFMRNDDDRNVASSLSFADGLIERAKSEIAELRNKGD
jgi:hypothetical protein